MRNKFLTLTVAAALISSLFAGCTPDAQQGGAGQNPPQSDGQTALPEGATAQQPGSDSSAPVSDASVPVSDAVLEALLSEFSPADYEESADYDASAAVNVTLNGTNAEISGAGAQLSGGNLVISSAGTYVLSGNFEGGVVVNANDAVVRVVLKGANIENTDGAAFYAADAKRTVLTLASGTTNSLTDGASYTEYTSDAPNGALFSQDDMTVNGDGSLTVTANLENGISVKDVLCICGGNIQVKAAENGVVGRDALIVTAGTLAVEAGKDGAKSNYDTDTEKGLVLVTGGTITIASVDDGIQSTNGISITGGNIEIVSGGGSALAPAKQATGDFRGGFMSGPTEAEVETGDDGDARGIIADVAISIAGGTIAIDSYDDTIHTNGSFVISDGALTLASGDDAIHADVSLYAKGGDVTVVNCYEGYESNAIYVEAGQSRITSSDDGINATDGNTSRGMMESSGSTIVISGGDVFVNANGGDGIDSNGSLLISGGTVLVNGNPNGGDGAFDTAGEFSITGGFVAGLGASGMSMAPTTEGANTLSMTFDGTYPAGTIVYVTDGSGNTVFACESANSFSHAVISVPALTAGETYTIYAGGSASGDNPAGSGIYESATGGTAVVTFEQSAGVTYVNTSGITTGGGGFMQGSGGWNKGGPGRKAGTRP